MCNTSPGLKLRHSWLHHLAEDAEYLEVLFYVAWLAEELIPWNTFILLSCSGRRTWCIIFRTEDLVQESTGKRCLHPVQERHTECDELSSYRSSRKFWDQGLLLESNLSELRKKASPSSPRKSCLQHAAAWPWEPPPPEVALSPLSLPGPQDMCTPPPGPTADKLNPVAGCFAGTTFGATLGTLASVRLSEQTRDGCNYKASIRPEEIT